MEISEERQRRQLMLESHPTTEHCNHNSAAAFAVVPPCAQAPQGVIGQPKTCCWCGPTRIHYIGIVEEGHGPFVRYEQGSQIIVAQG